MLGSLNVSRGMLRIWIVLTVPWMLAVGTFGFLEVSSATGGPWQYAAEMLEQGEPWKAYDGSKPFEEVFAMPSKAKWPASFSKVDWQYLKGFNDSVTKGDLTLVSFPDDSSLYLYTRYPKAEQELVSSWFWDARSKRRRTALTERKLLLPLAIAPPLVLLLLGLLVRWVVRGFQAS